MPLHVALCGAPSNQPKGRATRVSRRCSKNVQGRQSVRNKLTRKVREEGPNKNDDPTHPQQQPPQTQTTRNTKPTKTETQRTFRQAQGGHQGRFRAKQKSGRQASLRREAESQVGQPCDQVASNTKKPKTNPAEAARASTRARRLIPRRVEAETPAAGGRMGLLWKRAASRDAPL